MKRSVVIRVVVLITVFTIGIFWVIETSQSRTNFEVMEDLILGVDNVRVGEEVDLALLEDLRESILRDPVTLFSIVEAVDEDGTGYRVRILYAVDLPYIHSVVELP